MVDPRPGNLPEKVRTHECTEVWSAGRGKGEKEKNHMEKEGREVWGRVMRKLGFG